MISRLFIFSNTGLNNALTEMQTYSTEEKIVGIDCDGSTIYEKSYYSDSVNITSSTVIDSSITSANVKRVVDMRSVFNYNGQWYSDLSNADIGFTKELTCVVSLISSGVRILISNRTVIGYHITIRYVKAD